MTVLLTVFEGPGLTYALTALGILFAIGIASRSELHSQVAAKAAEKAMIEARADKARSDYVDMLEGQLAILKERMDECDERARIIGAKVSSLEAAERVCQEERSKLTDSVIWLTTENADLRRRLGEKLEPHAGV